LLELSWSVNLGGLAPFNAIYALPLLESTIDVVVSPVKLTNFREFVVFLNLSRKLWKDFHVSLITFFNPFWVIGNASNGEPLSSQSPFCLIVRHSSEGPAELIGNTVFSVITIVDPESTCLSSSTLIHSTSLLASNFRVVGI